MLRSEAERCGCLVVGSGGVEVFLCCPYRAFCCSLRDTGAGIPGWLFAAFQAFCSERLMGSCWAGVCGGGVGRCFCAAIGAL